MILKLFDVLTRDVYTLNLGEKHVHCDRPISDETESNCTQSNNFVAFF